MGALSGFESRLRMRHRRSSGRPYLLILCSVVLTPGPGAALAEARHPALLEDLKATAIIRSCAEDPTFLGVATLREAASPEGIKEVSFVIQIVRRNRALAAGKHAVHLHEFGQCEPCGDAGGHFDPGPYGFSSPDGNHPYHSGDLVNLEVDKGGRGFMRTVTSRVTLSPGPLSLFDEDGSAVIVHVDPDTYCPDGEAAGCAGGARAACGVLELAD